jgi:hypothetical protein
MVQSKGPLTNSSTSVPKILVPEVTSGSSRVTWCTIQALGTNTGQVTITAPTNTDTGGYTLFNPGDSLVLWAPSSLHETIDLNRVFFLPTVANEGVQIIYVR